MSVYVLTHFRGDGDGNGVTPLNHHYTLKGQQTCTIINVCVFVNTIQKEMEMDTEGDME